MKVVFFAGKEKLFKKSVPVIKKIRKMLKTTYAERKIRVLELIINEYVFLSDNLKAANFSNDLFDRSSRDEYPAVRFLVVDCFFKMENNNSFNKAFNTISNSNYQMSGEQTKRLQFLHLLLNNKDRKFHLYVRLVTLHGGYIDLSVPISDIY